MGESIVTELMLHADHDRIKLASKLYRHDAPSCGEWPTSWDRPAYQFVTSSHLTSGDVRLVLEEYIQVDTGGGWWTQERPLCSRPWPYAGWPRGSEARELIAAALLSGGEIVPVPAEAPLRPEVQAHLDAISTLG